MNNVLQNKFNETMNREGITVSTYIDDYHFKAFFRRLSDGLNQRSTMTMFYSVLAPMKAGTIITVNNEHYIALNCETVENTVYHKSSVIKCNGVISTQDADVIGLPFYGSGANSAFPSSGGTSVKYVSFINGQTEIITEDCELARKIEINDRFNAWGRTWTVENIFYVDGIVTLNIKIQADADISFEYGIQFHDIASSGYKIGDIVSLDATPTINGNRTDGTLTYTSNNTDVAIIDENGNIEFVGSGSVFFTISWSKHGISKETTESLISEIEHTDFIDLSVSAMEEVYIGLFDGECSATIKRNGETVHDIAFTAEVTDCNFANQIVITTNQQTGKITAHISNDALNLANKQFTLMIRVPDYGLTDRQTVIIKGLY